MDPEPAPAPDLPDNPALRSALAAGDAPAAAALASGAVVLAVAGPADDDVLVLVETPGGGTGLLASARHQRADVVVVDLAGPLPVTMTLDQLRSLTTPGAAPS